MIRIQIKIWELTTRLSQSRRDKFQMQTPGKLLRQKQVILDPSSAVANPSTKQLAQLSVTFTEAITTTSITYSNNNDNNVFALI